MHREPDQGKMLNKAQQRDQKEICTEPMCLRYMGSNGQLNRFLEGSRLGKQIIDYARKALGN